MQPYVLLWLRYTAFLVLYPLGVSSELASVALALPTIRATRPWSIEVRKPSAIEITDAVENLHNSVVKCIPATRAEVLLLLLQMPNKMNFAFDYYYACWMVVLLYLPGGFQKHGCGIIRCRTANN